jgi:DNA repair protein RadA
LSESNLARLRKEQEEETRHPSDGFFRLPHNPVQQRKERISTGSKLLDDLLDGGLEVGQITQFYGGPGTGKTHLCHTSCVILPSRYQALYIDTEGGFREDKIQSIAEARGLDWEQILQNVYVAHPKNSHEQELCIEEASCLLAKSDSNVKLLIVDSLMFYYRVEYAERSSLSQRAHRLNKYMHKLSNIARTNNIAVVVTNQLYSDPKPCFYADRSKPIGGNIVSYTSRYMIKIDYLDHIYRRAILEKSPCKGYDSCCLRIDESGFRDEGPSFISESASPENSNNA